MAIRYGAGPYPGLRSVPPMREIVALVMSPELMATLAIGVHPKAEGRQPQVKAFIGWLVTEAASHDAAMATMDNGAGI